jgi:hypothetical protein
MDKKEPYNFIVKNTDSIGRKLSLKPRSTNRKSIIVKFIPYVD